MGDTSRNLRGNVPQQAQRPAPYILKGHLHLTIEGSENTIDLGEIEIPIEINVGTRLQHGPAYRGIEQTGIHITSPAGGTPPPARPGAVADASRMRR